MKKYGQILMSLFLMTSASFADVDWNVETGYWSDGANWSTGVKPDGSQAVNIGKSSTSVCIINTDEGLIGANNYIRNGQTLEIVDGGRYGTKWTRWADGSSATINMSGNGTYVLNDDDLYIGFNGDCVVTMSDTSLITVQADDGDMSEELYIGDGGNALLQLNGSGVKVEPDRIHIGYQRFGTFGGDVTLEYNMDAGGAGQIVVQRAYIAEAGTANLLITASDITPESDIVLMDVTSGYSIGGNGVFDTLNGSPAVEGAEILVGGNIYALTYSYDATGDSGSNDIALLFVRSGKYMPISPEPADRSSVETSPLTLSWNNPDPNDGTSDITCTVYFGLSNDRSKMESVTLAPNISMVDLDQANFPTYGIQPLPDANDYYWYVSCDDASPGVDLENGVGMTWTFSTDYNFPPVVDAGDDQVQWGLPGVINLVGVVTDDNKPAGVELTLEWTQVSGTEVSIDTPDKAETTVSVTSAGVYEFQLTADDSVKQSSDIVKVVVGSDSCEASYLNGIPYNDFDFNQDCIVNLIDFASIAGQWLNCTDTIVGCD